MIKQLKNLFDYLFNEIVYGWILFPLCIIAIIAVSCDVCHARDPLPINPIPIVKPTKPPIVVKPSPFVKPTPGNVVDWSAVIEESPTAQKFITKVYKVNASHKTTFPTEKIVQDPLSTVAVKGVRWVKTYRLWTRADGKVIPLSNGWTAETILDAPTSVIVKPTVEVFK